MPENLRHHSENILHPPSPNEDFFFQDLGSEEERHTQVTVAPGQAQIYTAFLTVKDTGGSHKDKLARAKVWSASDVDNLKRNKDLDNILACRQNRRFIWLKDPEIDLTHYKHSLQCGQHILPTLVLTAATKVQQSWI